MKLTGILFKTKKIYVEFGIIRVLIGLIMVKTMYIYDIGQGTKI